MASVLVGVLAAAGSHLLWLRPSDAATESAQPGDREPGAYDSAARRTAESRQATTQAPTTEPTTTTDSSVPGTTQADPTTTTTRRSPLTPPSTTSTPSPEPTTDRPSEPADAVAEVVALVNQERARAGCAAVHVDTSLASAAQQHSDDMARRDYLSHTSPEGERFDERIEDAGYSSPAAENIAMGLSSAEAVMDAWMASDGHRSNILNCDITAIGVGLNASGWYWTQTFGY
nr:CAP domain-containing protein [Saccharomonospora amisosensis]